MISLAIEDTNNSFFSFLLQYWFMNVIAYIRVSTDKQDLENQKHALLSYAQAQKIVIQEFIHAEVSSRKSSKDRKIDVLLEKLAKGDLLLVTELSRLGRNMLETLNLINHLSDEGIKISFINQPELSTTAGHAKLLLAIYSYFAEAERDYISTRTKQGLAAAKAKGKQLGRPKGSRDKHRVLDPFRTEILDYLKLGLKLSAIRQIFNPQLDKAISYNAYRYFVTQDEELSTVWKS